ncbi:MAG: ABC transporter permease [Pseudomonadales bacterium]|nr:ABC transporter permease [Pseudomonadales bacterium]
MDRADRKQALVAGYLAKRIFAAVITVWFIATATFFGMHSIPGNPLADEKAVNESIRINLEKRYGLDKPVTEQYLIYLNNMLHGDFGISYTQKNRRVNDIIREHFPVSALLGLLALFFAIVGGIVWGALTALYHNRTIDHVAMLVIVAAISIPSFVIATLVQLGILKLNQITASNILPVAGWGEFRHMLLPALVLGLGTQAYLARLMRSSMLEIKNNDFIRTAKAKGLSPTRIFFSHQLRNAILPVISVLGPAIASITTGGFVVELIFTIPGLGRYFVEAVQQLDYTVIMGTTVFYGAFLVCIVLVVDILYALLDPRIRLEREA